MRYSIWMALIAVAGCWPTESAHAQDEARAAKTAAVLKGEGLGGLKLGLSEKEVIKQLGKPEKQGKLEHQAADGMYVQEWEYPSKGLAVTMTTGEKKTGAKKIASFSAGAPSALATKLGVKIGSPEAAVRKAYGSIENKEDGSPNKFVAGSSFGGIVFDLNDGKVSRIFFGAASE